MKVMDMKRYDGCEVSQKVFDEMLISNEVKHLAYSHLSFNDYPSRYWYIVTFQDDSKIFILKRR